MHPSRFSNVRALAAVATAIVVAIASPASFGQTATATATAAAIFKGADLALGSQLIEEKACTACHVRQVGGDGSAIFRPKGRISTPGYLRGMVEQCNTELNLGMFPEEVNAVAAVLNRDHYRFK
jgi:hypothetical protein